MGPSIFLTLFACSINLDKLSLYHAFETTSEHPTMPCLNSSFDFFINVFDVYVAAPQTAPLDYILHTSNVLAEYIDNDADGIPDDALVHEYLVSNQYLVPVWTEELGEELWQEIQGTACEDGIGMSASMYYDEDQWAIGGITESGKWDTNLEEVWHVVSDGWYAAYPEYFGTSQDGSGNIIPSKLFEAMDVARGGQFLSIPNAYPEEAWYTYYDDTCDYRCQAHEYFYWILMANLDALDPALSNKCTDSQDEWNICSQQELQQKDTLAFELLNNYDFSLPTNIPQGSYQGP